MNLLARSKVLGRKTPRLSTSQDIPRVGGTKIAVGT